MHQEVVSKSTRINNAPIGIFDSGFGGLTVARALMEACPQENIIYFGDSLRCPYGSRSLEEVRSFVHEIAHWLVQKEVKLIVIACNTATAAGLHSIQQELDIPVLGVVEPGARAAVRATRNNKVGVIATQATIASGIYTRHIRSLDEDITVFSTATPRFVDIAEQGIRLSSGAMETFMSEVSKAYIRPAFQEIAQDYLEPLRRCDIDTLVLGCTHFPLLKALIGSVVGSSVRLIDSAEEISREVQEILVSRLGKAQNESPRYEFFTTGQNLEEFVQFGSRVLNMPMDNAKCISLEAQ